MRIPSFIQVLSTVFISVVLCHSSYANLPFEGLTFGSNSSILVANEKLEPIYAWQSDKLLIPASTQKILTSFMALETWGRDHQFQTKFYLANDWLWVKGYGDPFLISEEIDSIAQEIAGQLIHLGRDIQGVGIDSTHFAKVVVPGRTEVSDPYNAPLSAVSANFNTIFINKKNQLIESAEIQTPLTPTAKKLAASLGNGEHRINVVNSTLAEQHFAELLRAKLVSYGLRVNTNIRLEEKPQESVLIYKHTNSHSLEKIVKASLRYSNNFIANQLFLALSADKQKKSLKEYQQWAKGFLLRRYPFAKDNWQAVTIEEGAGLSRNNRLSAQHLLQILKDFKPYEYLLKEYEDGQARAKTGTLTNVRTFAGYINVKKSSAIDAPPQKYRKKDKKYYFVFMLNEPTPFKYRETLLKQLVNDLKSL